MKFGNVLKLTHPKKNDDGFQIPGAWLSVVNKHCTTTEDRYSSGPRRKMLQIMMGYQSNLSPPRRLLLVEKWRENGERERKQRIKKSGARRGRWDSPLPTSRTLYFPSPYSPAYRKGERNLCGGESSQTTCLMKTSIKQSKRHGLHLK